MMRSWLVFALGVLGMLAFRAPWVQSVVVSAANESIQSPSKTSADGVYTEEQGARGQALTAKMCASCHGDKLEGTGSAPPLQGPDFMMGWNDKSVGELSEKIQTTMPADNAGTLTPAQVADLIAYIFKAKNFPAGSTELAAEQAQQAQIRIRAKS